MTCVDLSNFDPYPYFPTGLYTHLYIDDPYVNADGDTVVSWEYTFRDFGMDHTLSKSFLVRSAAQNSFLIKKWEPSTLYSDVTMGTHFASNHWSPIQTYQELLDALFGHYERFRADVYREMFMI